MGLILTTANATQVEYRGSKAHKVNAITGCHFHILSHFLFPSSQAATQARNINPAVPGLHLLMELKRYKACSRSEPVH